MQATWLLLVLSAGVPAWSAWNGTLEEVVVSSQALRVSSSEPAISEEADVRPLPRRRVFRSIGEGNLRNETSLNRNATEVTQTGQRNAETSTVAKVEEVRINGKEEGRGHMKKMKKTLKKLMPYLMVPGMMALGYAPFVLASLKMFVMNAVTINMMALNAAIFITLRNMVFGPRVGQHVKYYNFGYSHQKKHHHHRR